MADQKARCVHCRSDVSVPDSYAHGDHIKCGQCGTQHKVQRGDALRLVMADVTPLRDALRDLQQRIASLEAEWRDARASFGIGANGFGLGLIYVLYFVGMKNAAWSTELLIQGLTVGVLSGASLELANYLFLAKRKRMTQLTREIDTLREDAGELQQKIRDAMRG